MNDSIKKPRICFVALNAYDILSGRKDIDHVGGAEVQQERIASWLTQKGYSVSFVTLDHGQQDGIDINGINIFKAYTRQAGIPGLRFFHPRWTGLCKALDRADADIYYQRCAGVETGQVALWCHRHKRKFIFGAASNADCNPKLLSLKSGRDRFLYNIGLKYADTIIAQTETQQKLFQQNMGFSSTLVPNCGWNVENKIQHEADQIKYNNPIHVLWIGRISREKRFEWLLDVAEKCPDIIFDIVGAVNKNNDYVSSMTERAEKIHNVKMHGRVSYLKMKDFYLQSNVLCCTSLYEGFPNTFLEAWSIGIPVVSTFDPDGIIKVHGLGWVADNVLKIVDYLQEIMKSPDIWQKASIASRQYFLANHTREKCLPKFEQVILKLSR